MTRHSRTDANQGEIVDALRDAYCRVFVTSDTGDGFTDLVVWSPHIERLLLIEIKDGAKPPSKQVLTPAQVVFHRMFDGTGCCHVVNSVDQALRVVGVKV